MFEYYGDEWLVASSNGSNRKPFCPTSEDGTDNKIFETMFQVIKLPLTDVSNNLEESGSIKEGVQSKTAASEFDETSSWDLYRESEDNILTQCKSNNTVIFSTGPVLGSSAIDRQMTSSYIGGIRSLETIISSDPLKFDSNKIASISGKIMQFSLGRPISPDAWGSRKLVVQQRDDCENVATGRKCSEGYASQSHYCRVSVQIFVFCNLHSELLDH
jgi:hypothetical protein